MRAVHFTLLLAPGFCLGCAGAGPGPAASPRPRVLLVLAHPDDETMIGATLGRLRERGALVAALYATRGEGGKRVRLEGGRPVEQAADPAALALERRRELQRAAWHYGISRLETLDHPDQPFSDPATGKPTCDAARFLRSGVWRLRELRASISRLAEELQPEIVVTLRPDCPQVHAHHQALGSIAVELFRERRLGARARQIYGITEMEWYPPGSFPRVDGALQVPTATFSPTLRSTYAAFAQAGARLHESQLVAYQPPPRQPELLVPLGAPRRPDPLGELIGIDPGAAP